MSGNSGARGFSLKRWSQRKLAAARDAAMDNPRAVAVGAADAPGPVHPAGTLPPATPAVAAQGADGPANPAMQPNPAADALPPVESVTLDSDFTALLRPEIDEGLKRKALKQLFRDPRFNVMDGLDVYIDDYSKPDPIPPEVVRELVQSRYILDPPATRVNAKGEIEDVPVEEQAPVGVAGPAEAEATCAALDRKPPELVDATPSGSGVVAPGAAAPVAAPGNEPAATPAPSKVSPPAVPPDSGLRKP
jgi:hypothetical protein